MINKQCIILSLILTAISTQVLSEEQPQAVDSSFGQASQSVQKKLENSLLELNTLREEIAEKKIPLSKKLNDLESQLTQIRLDYQQESRLVDSRTLDMTNLQTEIKSRHEESAYMSNLLGEYIRNFESRLHIAEIQRYREALATARLATENTSLSEEERFQAQAKLLSISLERLSDAVGGTVFDGTAVDSSGSIHHGTFVMLGPSALFQSDDGKNVGTAEQRLGSMEPAVIPFGLPADADAVNQFYKSNKGLFPFDPTLGNAHKIEEIQETLLEHIKKGGPVMYPIFVLAGAALLVAFIKWLSMVTIRTPSQAKINELLLLVAQSDEKAARDKVRTLSGPVGKMLSIGIEHLKEPRELIEEVMYEQVLSTRLRLQRMLPFVALTSSSAPLMGLLGTVTGIMNTFTLMTVFGTGDVKTLSSGISEALITTEYGLYVAIPSLLMYAFLSRKAKGVLDEMEKAAVALVNQISKTPFHVPTEGAEDNKAVSAI